MVAPLSPQSLLFRLLSYQLEFQYRHYIYYHTNFLEKFNVGSKSLSCSIFSYLATIPFIILLIYSTLLLLIQITSPPLTLRSTVNLARKVFVLVTVGNCDLGLVRLILHVVVSTNHGHYCRVAAKHIQLPLINRLRFIYSLSNCFHLLNDGLV